MKARILSAILIMACAACADRKIDYTYPGDPENNRKQRGGKFFEDSKLSTPKKDEIKNDKINTKPKPQSSALWSSSVEVVGTLLPIVAADEKSGLIITDWYMDGDKTSERIKMNLLVKDQEIKEENLILTIFRQARNQDGSWIDEQSSNSNIAAKMIKDKIIQKALLKND